MRDGSVSGAHHWCMSLAVAAAGWALVSGTQAQSPASVTTLLMCPCASMGVGKDKLADIYWKIVLLT